METSNSNSNVSTVIIASYFGRSYLVQSDKTLADPETFHAAIRYLFSNEIAAGFKVATETYRRGFSFEAGYSLRDIVSSSIRNAIRQGKLDHDLAVYQAARDVVESFNDNFQFVVDEWVSGQNVLIDSADEIGKVGLKFVADVDLTRSDLCSEMTREHRAAIIEDRRLTPVMILRNALAAADEAHFAVNGNWKCPDRHSDGFHYGPTPCSLCRVRKDHGVDAAEKAVRSVLMAVPRQDHPLGPLATEDFPAGFDHAFDKLVRHIAIEGNKKTPHLFSREGGRITAACGPTTMIFTFRSNGSTIGMCDTWLGMEELMAQGPDTVEINLYNQVHPDQLDMPWGASRLEYIRSFFHAKDITVTIL